jgi:protein-tyrosine phosphatase
MMAAVRILFLCMGNICRSPTAEGVFRSLAAELAPELDLQADSAGTHGYHLGHAPDTRSQQVARARGVDLSALRARQLTHADFDAFDLILAMDQENLQFALGMAPARRRARVRLLLDFAPGQPLREVPDPYYGGLQDFELVFDLATQAARGLLQSLASGTALSPQAGAARALR